MTSKTISYPWDELIRSNEPEEYVAQLVSSGYNPRGRRLFWAKSYQGNPAFLVEYDTASWQVIPLPTFKNILVADSREESCLVVELLDSESKDFFLKVCLDIISALQEVPQKACRKACVLRLERWSSFLRQSSSRLSSEAQKGLIAELLFLEGDVLPVLDERSALRGWVGPEKAKRDFAYGQVFIEVKSKRSSANQRVSISSEEQLNVNSSEKLFLYVIELNDAPAGSKDSFTIKDITDRIRERFSTPLLRAEYDNKLASAGYFEEEDYSDFQWTLGQTYSYAVVEGFPKIDSDSCAPGVDQVSYQIDLDYCSDYIVKRSDIAKALE